MLTQMEEFLFDLQGYIVLKGAVSKDQLQRLNERADELLEAETEDDGWIGYVQRHGYSTVDGINFQNIVEGGEVFEELIDNPNWLPHAKRFVGEYDGLFIDECFLNVRGAGEGLYMHSGGWERRQRTQFEFQNGKFHCGMINMLTALEDIGPGDGATTVVPGTHKSNVQHPEVSWPVMNETGEPAKNVRNMIEVHLEAGDTLLFVDSLCHGAVARINSGQRRIVVYRYGPGWSSTRLGYQPSDDLLARLTPERRKLLQPVTPRRAAHMSLTA